MNITRERYLSTSEIFTRLTSDLQILTQCSIELRAAAFEGVFCPCVLEWFDDKLKAVLELHTQLKQSFSADNLLSDLEKEFNNEK